MATIKSYTDVNQSRKLCEILPLESADMCYRIVSYNPNNTHVYKPYCFVGTLESDIPCWSLAALIELIPTNDKKDEYYVNTESHSDYHTVSYRNCWDGCIHSEDSEESLLDAAFEMICWLKENRKI